LRSSVDDLLLMDLRETKQSGRAHFEMSFYFEMSF